MTPEQALLQLLAKNIRHSPFDGKVFVAGGYVRDQILGLQSKDIDLVIPMEDGGVKFAEWVCDKFGVRKVGNPVVFPRFGTASFHLWGYRHEGVPIGDIQVECVMTRREKYTDGSRKPEVEFGTLKEDAERRDFTINSLMMNVVTGEIMDLTGKGISDLKLGIVRSAIDPNIIFREDPLRMLRLVRFMSKYKYSTDNACRTAARINGPLLKTISSERIQEELVKMVLVPKHPSEAFYNLYALNLLPEFLPELDALKGVNQSRYHDKDVFNHIMAVLDATPPDLVTRLAALFHDIAKGVTRTVGEDGNAHFYGHEDVGADMTREILTRLKFPGWIIDSVSTLVKHHMRLKGAGADGNTVSDRALRRFAFEMGPLTDTMLDLMHADNAGHASEHQSPEQIPRIRERLTRLAAMQTVEKVALPINGHDVMSALQIDPGPAVKEALEKVREAWYDNPNLTRDEALELIRV